MPITKRFTGTPTVSLKKRGSREFDILLGPGDYIGSIDFTLARNMTKNKMIEKYEGNSIIKDLMSAVPDNFKFNEYLLDTLYMQRQYRGSGIGGLALQQWFSTMEAPACVTLLAATIDGIPVEALVKFYKRNGFKMFKHKGVSFGITFIKSRQHE